MDEDPQTTIQKQTFTIDWSAGEELEFPLSTHMIVNFDADNFYLRFYQIAPPVFAESRENKTIKAKVVSSVAIPHSQMGPLLRALIDNTASHQEVTGHEILREIEKDVDNAEGNSSY